MEYLPWIKSVLEYKCGHENTLEAFKSCGEDLLPKIVNPFTEFGWGVSPAMMPTKVTRIPMLERMISPRDRRKRSNIDFFLECATYVPMVLGLVLLGADNREEEHTTPPPFRGVPDLPPGFNCEGVEDYTIDEV